MRKFWLLSGFVLLTALLQGGCAATTSNRAWIGQHGGIYDGPLARRMERIAVPLFAGIDGRAVKVSVLDDSTLAAFSFSGGEIYISRGLLQAAEDDEIAAAIAHELGHLFSNGNVRGGAGGAALSGADQKLDAEAKADAIGVDWLKQRGIPASAMQRVLQRVVDSGTVGDRCGGMKRRIALLQNRG